MSFTVISWAIKAAKIKTLSLIDCAVDDEACVKIAAAVGLNKSLERLDLSNNNIHDNGCEILADGLTANTGLKHLLLSDNKRIGKKGYGALARMLKENYSLERLETCIGANHDLGQIDEYLKTEDLKSNSDHATAA